MADVVQPALFQRLQDDFFHQLGIGPVGDAEGDVQAPDTIFEGPVDNVVLDERP